MFSRIGATELLIILAMLLLIFGPKNLPKLGKAIGEAVGSFKSGQKESDDTAKVDGEKTSEEKTSA